MQKLYAQALSRLSHTEGAKTATLSKELMKHLTETGRLKLLPGILRELKILEARKAKLAPSVEVASEAEAHDAIAQAKKEGIEVTKAHVNHALIRGWRARTGGTLVDRSAKRGLIDLYRNVTS